MQNLMKMDKRIFLLQQTVKYFKHQPFFKILVAKKDVNFNINTGR